MLPAEGQERIVYKGTVVVRIDPQHLERNPVEEHYQPFDNKGLGCDWAPRYFLQRGKALSIPEINRILTSNDLSSYQKDSYLV